MSTILVLKLGLLGVQFMFLILALIAFGLGKPLPAFLLSMTAVFIMPIQLLIKVPS